MYYVTTISVKKDNPGLLRSVLRELPGLVDSFTCYPKDMLIICIDGKREAVSLYKALRDIVDTDDLYISSR